MDIVQPPAGSAISFGPQSCMIQTDGWGCPLIRAGSMRLGESLRRSAALSLLCSKWATATAASVATRAGTAKYPTKTSIPIPAPIRFSIVLTSSSFACCGSCLLVCWIPCESMTSEGPAALCENCAVEPGGVAVKRFTGDQDYSKKEGIRPRRSTRTPSTKEPGANRCPITCGGRKLAGRECTALRRDRAHDSIRRSA